MVPDSCAHSLPYPFLDAQATPRLKERILTPEEKLASTPPHDAEEPEPSFIVVYTKTGTPGFVVLSSIDHIEVEPLTRS
jgi:hypothetical protein